MAWNFQKVDCSLRKKISCVIYYIFSAHFRSLLLNWPKLTCNKSTQFHDAFIGHARQRHDLIGCSETRTVGARRVLHTEFANGSIGSVAVLWTSLIYTVLTMPRLCYIWIRVVYIQTKSCFCLNIYKDMYMSLYIYICILVSQIDWRVSQSDWLVSQIDWRAVSVKILPTVETSCTTNPQQMELEGYSWSTCSKQPTTRRSSYRCRQQARPSTTTTSFVDNAIGLRGGEIFSWTLEFGTKFQRKEP